MNYISNVQIISFLCKYLDETEKWIHFCDDEEFKKVSIEKWVAGELLELISTHQMDDPIDLILEFEEKMLYYSKFESNSEIFHMAAISAAEWLELFEKEGNYIL